MFPDQANMGNGTGMGALIPIWPASTVFSNLRPVAPDCVKIEAPLPSGSSASDDWVPSEKQLLVRSVPLLRR